VGGGSTPSEPITTDHHESRHVETLATLATEYERVGPVLGEYLRPMYARRAEAIRWALARIATAYPIEEHTAE
jgi:hypothetical protein